MSEETAPEVLSSEAVAENIRLIEDVKFFLATAPANWQKNQIIRRYYLNHDEGFVSCVFWNNLYFITGTDIVRCIVYRFQLFGREILDRKKFEEGVFSDLRSLKCGTNAVLENSKSPFLNFLYKNSCLRTQKKQKVFFWYSVPHDTLFADALERDLKKESTGLLGTTKARYEPALSFIFDDKVGLTEQLGEYVEEQRKKNDPLSVLENDDDDDDDNEIVPVSSILPENRKPSTFVIKEENNTPVVAVSNYDDDFPLDYFPHDDPMLFDPQILFNPPPFDNFDDSLLIDQTYTKTPFEITTFSDRAAQQIADDQLETIPISANPYFVPLKSARGTQFLQTHQPYTYQHTQVTNAQYYDSQLSGEPLDLTSYPSDYMQQPIPSQYPQSVTATNQPNIQPPAFYGNLVQVPPGAMLNPLYNDPYASQVIDPQYLFPSYNNGASYHEIAEDEFGNLEVTYPAQASVLPQQGQFIHIPGTAGGVQGNGGMMRMVSPFSNYFPSFEAMNPPKSGKRAKFVLKPTTIPKQRVSKDVLKKNGNVVSKLNKSIRKGTIKIREPQSTQQSTSSSEDPVPLIEDEEYGNSLPTPESTAHEKQ